MLKHRSRNDILLVAVFLLLTVILYLVPTGYEERINPNSVRARGLVLEVDDSELHSMGLIRKGSQVVVLEILDGPHKGEKVQAHNQLLGRLDLDKVYRVGDKALVVLSLDAEGGIVYVHPQDHYRLGFEVLLFFLFALLLIGYGGWTGVKALLSFAFTGLMIWKVVAPLLLNGYDPILVALCAGTFLTAAIIFLVAGPTRKGLTAFLGAFMGILLSCVLSLVFVREFQVHGAVMPFAETLLYSGFDHLNLSRLFSAAVFFAASGAVMDLAMDVSASMQEVVEQNPNISRLGALKSGLSVGRAVVGTMTTTLLLAYSGGYLTLLMAFMAQGVPVANMVNLIYVAAEIMKTLVGSFGLVAVAPFTALVGAFIFKPGPATVKAEPLEARSQEALKPREA